MKLFVDGQEKDILENENASLRDVVERIAKQLMEEENRVVAELLVDGMQMGNWDDPEFVKLTVGGVSELRINTDNPRNQSIKILYEIASYMPEINKNLIGVSEKIQSRQEEEGLQHLAIVMENWVELQTGMENAVNFLGIDFNDVQVGNSTFEMLRQGIVEHLDSINELFADRRLLEISDVLEYELAPRVEGMEEGIYQIIKIAEKKMH